MVKIILLIILGVLYLSNSWLLTLIHPNVSADWKEFLAFIADRNKLYEFMFTGFFFISFLDSKRFAKSIACFFMILTTGSFIDKTLFNITHYLLSDIILVIVALLISYYVYVRETKGPA